ncbi:MAG TPA: ATP-dependent RNA helicase HrpA, partial [Candidatus Duodenibacillus intestinigallinarum]|nr:ATP-dependent RNA helicase HrpA [Candidatus Duodenibacillus intestinigallinarum]
MSQNDNPFGALKSLVEKGQIQTKAWVPTSPGSKKLTAAALRYADASVKKAFEESTRQQNRKEPESEKPAAKPETKPAPRTHPVRREPQAVKMPEKQLIERKHESKRASSKAQQVKDQSKAQPMRMKAERRLLKTVQPDSANESSRRELMPVAQTRRSPFVPPNPITKPVTLAPGLPVSEHGEELVKAIRENPVIVVCGETGSGKTTQLPKICLLAGRGTKGLIGHTQPRRIAASSIAKRIAAELESEVGEIVGYKVRFTDKTMPGAAIKLMTDGILLAETQTDPLLKRYDTIIIDEAHERSINIDFLLGYLKRVLAKRKDLKVIITSATIDAERFAKHFEINGKPAPVFTISGRTYPVQIRWRPVDDTDEADDKTLMDAVADACDELQIAGRGDILVFLPGEREIREAAEVLRARNRPGLVEILPLYARLSAQEQERVFKSGGVRRIVLATNVAETSITVPGIRYVVDTGLARIKRYSYRNKVEQLLVEPVSKASANQRAGRCGRVADGICIRLYDENDWARRPDYTDPEIVRSNLAAVILRMKALKLGDVRNFDFVQPPPPKAIADGYAILSELHALEKNGELTDVGRMLSRLPVDPKLSRMLLEASRRGALKEALVVVSGLAVQDPRERPLPAQQQA